MKPERNMSNIQWWQPALSLFVRLSSWIAFPVVTAVFLGNWLDKKYGSEPFGLIAVVGIAFIFSMIGLVYETGKEYQEILKNEKIKSKIKGDEK